MAVYLDANVLVALFSDDPLSARACALLQANLTTSIVSDFAAAEFASVIGRQVRIGSITADAARRAFGDFDIWASATQRVQITPGDIRTAETFLRQLNLNLRTPDAVHLAMSQRLRADLATFDKSLSICARALKIPLARSPSP